MSYTFKDLDFVRITKPVLAQGFADTSFLYPAGTKCTIIDANGPDCGMIEFVDGDGTCRQADIQYSDIELIQPFNG